MHGKKSALAASFTVKAGEPSIRNFFRKAKLDGK
jgi:hypothetical protein